MKNRALAPVQNWTQLELFDTMELTTTSKEQNDKIHHRGK